MPMRFIVTGSRDLGKMMHQSFVDDVLDALIEEGDATSPPDKWPVIVHGNATGADHMAETWAHKRRVLVERHPADWAKHGSAAGPIRNTEMANAGADLCIAFPGGKGTSDMIQKAKAAGIKVALVPDKIATINH